MGHCDSLEPHDSHLYSCYWSHCPGLDALTSELLKEVKSISDRILADSKATDSTDKQGKPQD